MSHVRAQIRAAAVALLTGLNTTADRVFSSRCYVLRDEDLPALLIKTSSEVVIETAITFADNGMVMRDLSLTVEGYAQQDANLDNTLDQIALEVETALNESDLGGLVLHCLIDSTQIEFDDTFEQPIGKMTLNFKIRYTTTANNVGNVI